MNTVIFALMAFIVGLCIGIIGQNIRALQDLKDIEKTCKRIHDQDRKEIKRLHAALLNYQIREASRK